MTTGDRVFCARQVNLEFSVEVVHLLGDKQETLVAFFDGAEAEAFMLLLKCKGVGPMTALALIDAHGPDVVRVKHHTHMICKGVGDASALKIWNALNKKTVLYSSKKPQANKTSKDENQPAGIEKPKRKRPSKQKPKSVEMTISYGGVPTGGGAE
jgi:Holliday junction resolvasome RuvABC DNA-binding subunit